jgi:hypothetical protein
MLLCVDDGAVVYLNGAEIGRENMPTGPVKTSTLALRVLGNNDEGLYHRLVVPSNVLLAGRNNVLAVEVHQAALKSSDLFFDLALRALRVEAPPAEVTVGAQQIVEMFHKQHLVGFGVTIPDGYIDGGRRMRFDAQGLAESGREILVVDRAHDAELADDLAFARSPELRALPPLERIQRLAARIDRETTPPGGGRWVAPTVEQLEKEFANKPVLLGNWMEQCDAGVCRHRGLLFKLLADEAGLEVALVRGNYAHNGPPGVPHVWNEVLLPDGRRIVVDVMHHGGKAYFPEVTDPEVVRYYLKVDDRPWYGSKAD